jgi:hypothetical protein
METNKYQNGKIYKIVDNGYNKCYIGSTCETLSMRMVRHRAQFNQWKQGKNHRPTTSLYIFEEFGVNNCKIELLENFPCESKEQLLKQEGFHIKNTECVNKRIECQTRKEYRDIHKEDMKQYRLNNKEIIAEQTHQYWINNKERMREWRNEKFRCDTCNGFYTRNSKTTHEKTEKHLNALKGLESTGLVCSVCRCTYTWGHRRRHERSVRHIQALEASTNNTDSVDSSHSSASSSTSESRAPPSVPDGSELPPSYPLLAASSCSNSSK